MSEKLKKKILADFASALRIESERLIGAGICGISAGQLGGIFAPLATPEGVAHSRAQIAAGLIGHRIANIVDVGCGSGKNEIIAVSARADCPPAEQPDEAADSIARKIAAMADIARSLQ